MTVSRLQTEFYGDVGVWIDFANLTCDLCEAVYPPNGLLSEYPSVVFEARAVGWQVLGGAGPSVVCCPSCHQRIVDEEYER